MVEPLHMDQRRRERGGSHYREPNGVAVDDLAPARGIMVSAALGLVTLAILLLLIM